MLTGKVRFFHAGRGYGFIIRDDGETDVFVHASELERSGIVGGLAAGDVVRFLVEAGKNGRGRAAEIELVSRGDQVARTGGRA